MLFSWRGCFLCIKNGGALWAASAPGSSMDCWVRAAAWWWCPLLSALGVRGKKSHATALMVIVPLSLVSAILYLVQGRVTVMDALPWLPGSLLGAYLGSRLMPKISTGWLKLVFGGLMLWGGIRLL